MLERVRPLEAEDVPLEDGRRTGARRGRALGRRPAAVPGLGDGRLRAPRGRRAGDAADRRADRRRPPGGAALEAGEAMAIATGGVVPEGADSVVPIEDVEERDDAVIVPGAVGRRRQRARRAAATSAPETRSSSPARGSARRTSARSRPPAWRACAATARRVSSWSSPGPSSLRPGEPLGPGEIYDANGFILATQMRSAGAEVERLPPVKDDADATRAAIERGLAADVLVTTGGVSVGVYDLVRAAEAELGVEEVFWRVAVRPGKPIAFGVRGRDARLRAAGQPGLVARRLRAVRPPGAARAAGRRRRPRRRSGPAGSARRGAPARRARLAAARPLARRGRRRSCSTRSRARSRT